MVIIALFPKEVSDISFIIYEKPSRENRCYIKTLSLKILEKSKETQGRGKDRQKTPQDEGFSLPTYKEMGITLNLASESQRLAELP